MATNTICLNQYNSQAMSSRESGQATPQRTLNGRAIHRLEEGARNNQRVLDRRAQNINEEFLEVIQSANIEEFYQLFERGDCPTPNTLQRGSHYTHEKKTGPEGMYVLSYWAMAQELKNMTRNPALMGAPAIAVE